MILTESEEATARTEYNRMLSEFAKFCGLQNPKKYDEWYRRGAIDFPKLLEVDGVVSVGVDWEQNRIIVLTEMVIAFDKRDARKELGEYIVFLDPFNKTFTFENVTEGAESSCGTYMYPHPHIHYDGEMCITTGRMEIITAMIDARYSISMTVIMAALRMRYNEGTFEGPYITLERWPTKELE